VAIKVILLGEGKEFELNYEKLKVGELSSLINVRLSEYVVLRDNEILTEEDYIYDGDVVKLFTVKSGG